MEITKVTSSCSHCQGRDHLQKEIPNRTEISVIKTDEFDKIHSSMVSENVSSISLSTFMAFLCFE
jgi:hypothetical protein